MSLDACQRVPAAQLDRGAAPILSKITIESPAGGSVADALAAFEAGIKKDGTQPYAATDDAAGFLLPGRWEPPFKLARTVSGQFPDLRVSVVADAFQQEYWLARAVFVKGRAEVEETLTFNDGEAFETLFQQIHGEPYSVWKTKNKQGGVRGGFSWGTSDDYDPSKSELGKAEGQI